MSNKIEQLYVRAKRGDTKPALPFQHKNAIRFIEEFKPFVEHVETDADLRSLCSQCFAKAFYEVNK